MLRVRFHRQAYKQFTKLPIQIQRRVVGSLDDLEKLNHPLEHRHIIRLAGRGRADFRLRIGDYRVNFTLYRSHEVLITRVDHRQAGY
jgi:mRNA-degrading endonuclease RelE of RelBE toxin-antitoxin system